ncbi:hypothetical protein KBY29_19215 [Ruegeria pomeroyi]|nr:hypothetical protein [Ruegeria pomeroyi]
MRSWVEKHLDELYPIHTTAFCRLLVELRKNFDGDLDSLLILALLSVGTQMQDWQEILTDREWVKGQSRPTNTQSISDVSGIPRESVRRKLTTLQNKGWVMRNAEGNWEIGGAASRDLLPSTHAAVDYIASLLTAAEAAGRRKDIDG